MWILIAFISLWEDSRHTQPASIYSERFGTKNHCQAFENKLKTEFGGRLRESRCVYHN
jgi:hypothetical protein